jgi:hypothetical protein
MENGTDMPTSSDRALEMLGYTETPDSTLLQAFAARWGAVTPKSLESAIGEGEGEEKLFAIFALGYSDGLTLAQRNLIQTQLADMNALVRWASAICLGQAGDKRALPVLCQMLTEYLPQRWEDYFQAPEPRFEQWRTYAPILLGSLGEPLAMPPLRQTLRMLVKLLGQQTVSPDMLFDLEPADYPPEQRNLVFFQDDIVYALGRLGAFGALTGLNAAAPYLDMWMVHLVMGSLHGQYGWEDMMRWKYFPELEADITHALLSKFGLGLDEQTRALDIYGRKKLVELIATYREELMSERSHE